MLKPNLYILGAPKCGTTSLFHWLSQQRRVFTPKLKEPHYFYNPYGKNTSAERYFNLYRDYDSEALYAVDASVWYLFSRTAVSQIVSEIESPRFIVCLRNPMELAQSLHFQKIYSNHEMVRDFASAWELSDERFDGAFSGIRNLPKNADPAHMSYKHASYLGRQVSRLLEVVDPKAVHFCFLEDISENPEDVFTSLCDFLEIVPSSEIIFSVENRAKGVRSQLLHTVLNYAGKLKYRLGIKKATGVFSRVHNVNRKVTSYAEPDEDVRREMRSVFTDDVALLEKLTDRDLSHWLV